MFSGMKLGVELLVSTILVYALIIYVVTACTRSMWLIPIVAYGTAVGIFVSFCGLVGAALGL